MKVRGDMREIKFRAWDKEQKRLVYDFETIPYFNSHVITKYNTKDCMQYTGLKDKNGVEIYEGDIVDFWSRRDYDIEAPFYINRRKRRVVQWISNSYKNTINIRKPKDENLAYHEVIGNIYENPELLDANQ